MISRQLRWSLILTLALLLIAAGYWGPWVAHKAAALVIPGLDLAEYVKFLPEYREGQIAVFREGFYLPLITLSLALSTLSWHPAVRWPTLLRTIAWLGSIPSALAMLPPAWSPVTLRLPEFRLQVIAIAICLIATAAAPIWRRVPIVWLSGFLALLSLTAIVIPIGQFWIIRPALDHVYGHPIAIGRGPWIMALGEILFAIGVIALSRGTHPSRETGMGEA